MRRLVLVLGAGLLAGCAVGPDFTRPEATTPDAFRMAESGGDVASIANTPWWELLKDQELQKLIRTALEENKDLKRAAAAVEEFQARLFVARTDFAPQMNVTANAPLFGRKTNFLFRISQPF